MGQSTVFELGDDLLDHSVVALGLVGLDHAQVRVGDEAVVSVGGEQFTLGGAVTGEGWRRRTRRTMSRQVTCSDLRRLVNATKSTSATSASEIQRCSASSHTALGYWIGCQASTPMSAIALATAVSRQEGRRELKDALVRAATGRVDPHAYDGVPRSCWRSRIAGHIASPLAPASSWFWCRSRNTSAGPHLPDRPGPDRVAQRHHQGRMAPPAAITDPPPEGQTRKSTPIFTIERG